MASAHDLAQRLWRADSVAMLFGTMDTDKLSAEDQIAVGEAQSRAVDDWLSAYAEFKAAGTRPAIPPAEALGRPTRAGKAR